MTGSSWPRAARWALGLWVLLAIVVFNVTFDWQSRMAAHAFVQSQIVRHQQGQPTLTINNGFRPMVRKAALDSSLWLVVIAVGGGAAVAATRGNKR